MDTKFENPVKDTGKRRGRPPGRKNNKTLAKEQEVKDMQSKATKSKKRVSKVHSDELEYTITIDNLDDYATVEWEDGAKQTIALNEGDADLIRNGADPVKDGWEDGAGNTVCYGNAVQGIDKQRKDMARKTKSKKSKLSKGWDAEVYNKINEIFESELPDGQRVVPDMGDASTDFGQAVRYLSKLVYRYYNDGDVALATVGERESSVNVALSYLEDECNDSKVRQCAEKLGEYVVDYIGDIEDSDLHREIAEELAEEQMDEVRDEFYNSEEYNALWDSEDEYIDEEGAFEEWLDEYYGGEIRPEDVEDYAIEERLSNMVYDMVNRSDFEAGYEQRLETLAQAVYQYANQEYEKLKITGEENEGDLDYYEDGWYYADKSRKHRKSKSKKKVRKGISIPKDGGGWMDVPEVFYVGTWEIEFEGAEAGSVGYQGWLNHYTDEEWGNVNVNLKQDGTYKVWIDHGMTQDDDGTTIELTGKLDKIGAVELQALGDEIYERYRSEYMNKARKSKVRKGEDCVVVTVELPVPHTITIGGDVLEFRQGISGRFEYSSDYPGKPKLKGDYYEGTLKAYDEERNLVGEYYIYNSAERVVSLYDEIIGIVEEINWTIGKTAKKTKTKTIKGHTGTFRPIAKAGHYTMWESVEHGSKAYNIITQTMKHARTGELVEKIVAEDVDGFDDPKAKRLGIKQE